MRLTRAGMGLVAVAIATFVCVLLLTPLSGLETRPIPSIHPIGLFSLVLVFATAALDALAIVLVSRRPRASAIMAGLGIFLVTPGFILDQTNQFSTYAPPAAIRALEYVLVVSQLAALAVGVWLYRETRCAESPPTPSASGPAVPPSG